MSARHPCPVTLFSPYSGVLHRYEHRCAGGLLQGTKKARSCHCHAISSGFVSGARETRGRAKWTIVLQHQGKDIMVGHFCSIRMHLYSGLDRDLFSTFSMCFSPFPFFVPFFDFFFSCPMKRSSSRKPQIGRIRARTIEEHAKS